MIGRVVGWAIWVDPGRGRRGCWLMDHLAHQVTRHRDNAELWTDRAACQERADRLTESGLLGRSCSVRRTSVAPAHLALWAPGQKPALEVAT